MATDKNGKLTFQMKSPGQAWMDYVNSKEGHNAAVVTPEYLKPTDKNMEDPFFHERISKLKQMANQLKTNQPREVVKAINKNLPSR